MHRSLFLTVCAAGLFSLYGCADPVDPAPDGGEPADAALPIDAGPTPDAGTPAGRRVRAVGFAPGGGTSVGPNHTVTGLIGNPSSQGVSSGPDHTIIGGAVGPTPQR